MVSRTGKVQLRQVVVRIEFLSKPLALLLAQEHALELHFAQRLAVDNQVH